MAEPVFCDGCRFYVRRGTSWLGHCHRYPPPFPETDGSEWCGEFKEKEPQDGA